METLFIKCGRRRWNPMKKKLASVVTCTLLAPMLLNGNTNHVYAENPSKLLFKEN
jgi:hypothetical protein